MTRLIAVIASTLLCGPALANVPLTEAEEALLQRAAEASTFLDKDDDLHPRLVPRGPRTDGQLIYEYMGITADLELNPRPKSSPTHRFVYDPAKELRTPADQLIGSTVVDAFGRMWRVQDMSEALWKEPALTSPAPSMHKLPHAAGEIVEWTPQNWEIYDCDNDGKTELYEYNGNDVNLSSNGGYDEWERTAVMITNTAEGGNCSGSLITRYGDTTNTRWVMTAAHCVENGSDSGPAAPTQILVNNYNRSQRQIARTIVVNSDYSYSANSDFGDDIALIEMRNPFRTFGGRQPALIPSRAGQSIISALDAPLRVSAPGWDNGQRLINGNDYCDQPGGFALYSSDTGDITSVSNSRIYYRTDAAKGMSGAAYHYCPTADNSICLPGENGYAYGVHAGFVHVFNRASGPRVAEWHGWIDTFLP